MDETAHCAGLLRAADRTRYLADLYAPEALRADLFALHAFDVEVAGIPAKVSEPMAGEIRLQWWHDALEEPAKGSGHPVAAALHRAIGRHGLPAAAFLNLLEARIADLYDDPVPGVVDLEGYAGETASAMLQLGCLILAEGDDPGTAELCGHGGVALAFAAVLDSIGADRRRGRTRLPSDLLRRHDADPLAEDGEAARRPVASAAAELAGLARAHLDKAFARFPDAPRKVLPALLPLAPLHWRLDRLAARDDPFQPVRLPPWRAPWAVWRGARRWPARMKG